VVPQAAQEQRVEGRGRRGYVKEGHTHSKPESSRFGRRVSGLKT
jgi:hypothetical protein